MFSGVSKPKVPLYVELQTIVFEIQNVIMPVITIRMPDELRKKTGSQADWSELRKASLLLS